MNAQKLALIILLPVLGQHAHAVTGKSFFSPRSVASELHMHQAASDAFIKNNDPAEHFTLSATTFYQESTNGKDLAQFFFPNNKTELIIKGANAGGNAPDISGTWLQIAGINTVDSLGHGADEEALFLNEFSSRISLHPKLKRFGSTLYIHKQFHNLCKGLSATVQLPFVQVQTNTQLHEYDKQNEFANKNLIPRFQIPDLRGDIVRLEVAHNETILNAKEAFNNPLWRYGKITNQRQKKAGLSDSTIRIGYNILESFSVHTQLTIPTSNKATASHMFEPLLGNGGRWSLDFGFEGNLSIPTSRLNTLHLASTFNYAHLFRNTERRSLDLASHGAWSRYMLVVEPEKANEVLQPGINFFTQPVDVAPGSEVTWNSLIHVGISKHISCELGYTFWGRAKDNIKLKSWNNLVNIASESFGNADADAAFRIDAANSNRTIAQHLNGGGGLLVTGAQRVTQNDFDTSSAEHPTSYSNTVYATLSTQGSWNSLPYQLALGSSYEKASSNKALELWTCWFKTSFLI